MNKNGLTISMIFDASSANYGEGIGNISQLKKMTRAGGKVYTYISRQAIRYNIVQQMGIDTTPVDVDGKVAQFAPSAQITDYPEIDLFGYMKTKKNDKDDSALTRPAVVRLSNAISLEPYMSDTDFMTNIGLANRIEKGLLPIQSEIHKSLYAYTITVDLDRVGVDGKNKEINISNEEKTERVVNLLETIEFLWRDIKGRRENLNPVFAVGGVYERKNPYFEDRLKLKNGGLDTDLISDVINSCDDTKSNTVIGSLCGIFANDNDIKEKLSPLSVSEMFAKIKEEVKKYYA